MPSLHMQQYSTVVAMKQVLSSIFLSLKRDYIYIYRTCLLTRSFCRGFVFQCFSTVVGVVFLQVFHIFHPSRLPSPHEKHQSPGLRGFQDAEAKSWDEETMMKQSVEVFLRKKWK